MISSRQIKAARALLGWTQTELAKASSLHLNAINKIENGQGEPRVSSLERIKTSCESAGLRFRGQRGVELREDVFEVMRFDGADFLKRLTDDCLSIVKGPDDEVLNCTADERLFDEADPRQNARYYRHMKKTGFRERFIMSKAHQLFINEDKSVYRWLPEKALGTITYVTYGDRVSFINWPLREILLIRSHSLAATYRGQFEFLWAQARLFN